MMLKKFARYLIILLATIMITIGFAPHSSAQFSFLPNVNNIDDSSLPETPVWDLNKAKPCGKYWCSNVYFYGIKIFAPETITVALPRDLNKTLSEIALDVEQRAKFIQKIFQQIFDRIRQSNQLGKYGQDENWRFWLLPSEEKRIHPLTPIVDVGIENGQTVIFVTKKPGLNLSIPQQTIVTVTEIDAKANNTTIKLLAQQWSEEVKESLSEAIWGLEMDIQNPFLRIKVNLIIVVSAFVLLSIAQWIKYIIKKWKKNLTTELADIQASLTINPEGQSQEQTEDLSKDNQSSQINQAETNNIRRFLFLGINHSKKVIADGISLSTKLLPTKLRQKQNLVRQQINICELVINVIRLLQLTCIFIAIASIVFSYRETRFLFNLFVTQALVIQLIWVIMVLLDKMVDFWVDFALDKWAKQRQEEFPDSNRPSLRVNTYSLALRGATTVLFTTVGIFLTLGVIGLSPTVIASAGALAVVFAFLSRNLLEDMLNGILILATDRYAVGDVIEINGLAVLKQRNTKILVSKP